MEDVRWVFFDVLLRRRVGRDAYDSWFRTMEVHEATKHLMLVMPTRFHIRWVDTYYRDDILAAAQEAWPEVRRIAYARRKLVRNERGWWTYQPDFDDIYQQETRQLSGS